MIPLSAISAGLMNDLHHHLKRREPEWPLLSAGDLEVGVDVVPGPGSRGSSYFEASRMVERACRSLIELGARRAALMTFHGSPLHNLAIHRGVELLEKNGVRAVAPMPVILRGLISGDTSALADAYANIAGAAEREDMIRDIRLDFHAGFLETSLALHYAPRAVFDHHRVPTCPQTKPMNVLLKCAGLFRAMGKTEAAEEIEFLARALPWYQLRPFPGYTGRPGYATRESGSVIARVMVEAVAKAVEQVFFDGAPPPRPVMRWMLPLTLGGRVGRIDIPLAHIVDISSGCP